MRLEAAYYATHAMCWAGTLSEHENERLATEWLFLLGNVELAELQAPRIYEVLGEQSISNSTKNRKLSVLSKILHVAKDQGHLQELPKLTMYREPRPTDRSLTSAEFKRIYAAVGAPAARHACTLLYETGARVSELLAMDLRDVDLEQHTWRIPCSKNGDPRIVPLTTTARDTVRDQRDLVGKVLGYGKVRFKSGAVFGAVITQRQLSYEWEKARAKADLEHFRLHDLRHTNASRLVRRGVPLFTVSHLLGHRDIRTTMRYAHLDITATKAAMETLEKETDHEANLIG